MTVASLVLLGCTAAEPPQPAPQPADTAPVAPDTAPPADTGEPDTRAVYTDGIKLVALDTETYAGLGYQLQTYAVTADHARPLETPAGSAPRFHVLSPPSASDARPLLVILHGGSMDTDAEQPGGVYGRCEDAHGISYGDNYTLTHPAAILGAAEGWVVLIPENSFCDGWTGAGPTEPTGPEHGGYALIEAAVAYLQRGQGAVAIDDDHLVLMGHSAGARGATYFTARHPGVSALVFDSGASDVVRYYYEDAYTSTDTAYLQDCLDHNLGGPPYTDAEQATEGPHWERYRDLGLVQALEAARVPVPIFHVFNAQDGTSPPVQHEDIGPLLAARGIRHAQLDTNRRTPSHPQISKSWPPAYAALRFGLGAQLRVVEAESGAGPIGRETRDNVYFNTTARTAIPADGPGELVTLPLETGATGTVRVVPVLYGESDTAEAAVTVSVTGPDGTASATLRGDQLVPPNAAPAAVAPYISAVTLEARAPETLTVTVTGAAEVTLDTVLLSWTD